MLPGEPFQDGSSPAKEADREPLVKHIRGAKQLSLHPTVPPLTARPIAQISPSGLSREQPNHALKYPRLQTSVISSSAIVINEDLLKEILLQLPAKSLLRFQTVCREWLSIISSPAFRRLHTRRYLPTVSPSASLEALFVFQRRRKKPPQLNFISISEDYVNPMGSIVSHLSNFSSNGQIMCLHSCNGLLAIVLLANNDDLEFILYNPTTNEHRTIHHPPAVIVGHFLALNVIYDPLKPDYYKLVCVCTDSDTRHHTEQTLTSIYSSETGTWRDIDETFDVDNSGLRTYFENGVLWNGDLHWISDWKYTFCLDLDKEVLNWNCPSLPVPFGEGEFWEFWYFGVCGGSLCVIEVNNRSALLFDVFEMTRDYSQWVFKYRIDLAPLTTLYPTLVRPNDDGECRFSISCLYEDEVEKIGRLVISMQGKVILYNVKDITVKELANVGKQDLSCWENELIQWQDICQHKETFAFV